MLPARALASSLGAALCSSDEANLATVHTAAPQDDLPVDTVTWRPSRASLGLAV